MLELLAYSDFTKGYPNYKNNKLFYKALKDVEARRNILFISLYYRKFELRYNKVLFNLDINIPIIILSICLIYYNLY
jgi:hypothetical protein